jgi:transitional endoplasmic reticulum ATPase
MSDQESLRHALSESPENVPLLQLYAQSCLDAFSLSEARESYERILRLQPNAPEARLGVARVLYIEGRTSEAAIRAETLIKEKPDFAPAFAFLSRLYLSENNHALASDFYHRAVSLSKQAVDPALEKELGMQRVEKGDERSGEQRYFFGGEWRDDDSDLQNDGDEDFFFDDDEDEDALPGVGRDFALADFERPKVNFADEGAASDAESGTLQSLWQNGWRRRASLWASGLWQDAH